jgi:hypothetical protein
MAGFVKQFSEYCGISYQYGRKINAIRKTFVDRELQNFGSNAVYALLLAPEKLMGQAKFCAVHCTFLGSRFQEAIDFVTMRQVDRGHWNSQEKEYFYVKRAEALGVRKREDSLKQNTADTPNGATVPSQEEHADALGVQSRGGDRGNQYQSGNPTNVGMAPSAQDHADALGVADRTIERWEKDRKSEINVSNDTMIPSAKDHADAFPYE